LNRGVKSDSQEVSSSLLHSDRSQKELFAERLEFELALFGKVRDTEQALGVQEPRVAFDERQERLQDGLHLGDNGTGDVGAVGKECDDMRYGDGGQAHFCNRGLAVNSFE